MNESPTQLTLAILVFASLILLLAAIIALVRSGRIPGLGATSGRAVDEVAAALRNSKLGLEALHGERPHADAMDRPARA